MNLIHYLNFDRKLYGEITAVLKALTYPNNKPPSDSVSQCIHYSRKILFENQYELDGKTSQKHKL